MSNVRIAVPGLFLSLFSMMIGAADTAGLIAERMDESTVALRPGGYDAIGGVGDWLLGNGVVCAVVSDAGHETGLSEQGGWLVDLGHCGKEDDQLSYTHFMPMMEQERMGRVVAVDASVADGVAGIRVRREDGELRTTVRYQLEPTEKRRLRVTTRIERVAKGDALSLVGQLWLHPSRSLTPFSLDTRRQSESPGFDYPSFSRDDKMEALQAMHRTDLTVLVGETLSASGISYGVRSERAFREDGLGQRQAVEQFTLVEQDYTNQIWLTRPLWFGGKGKPGRLEMLQSLFMDLDVGETLHIEQSLIVGDAADVASVTDQLYQGALLSGSLDAGPGRVAVFDGDGRPLTEVGVDADGTFSARLPRGLARCRLRITTPWGFTRDIDIALPEGDYQLPAVVTDAPGELQLPQGSPLYLVFKGVNGTADPVFGNHLPRYRLGRREIPGPSQSNSIALVGLPSDPSLVEIAPGEYRVFAGRGMEYDVQVEDILVETGKSSALDFSAARAVVDSGGWVSVDFHVHSGYSFDGTLLPEQRLASFVAQGADVLVASEHDYVADLGRLARQLQMSHLLTVVSGVEVTGMAHTSSVPNTLGHVNIYPWPRDETAFAGGLPLHEGKRLRQLIAELRQTPESPLIQLNHPRDQHEQSPDLAFYDHLSIGERYDPRLPLSNVQNRSLVEVDPRYRVRDIDFDTFEMANGPKLSLYQLSRADWLAMILQDEYRPALASSDSHSLQAPVAMPRSYVAYAGEERHPLNRDQLLQAVRDGRVFGSSGPIPKVLLQARDGKTAGIGDMASGRQFILQLSASAAPWVDVSQVWVYVNGSVVNGMAYRKGELLEVPIEVVGDSFVFVEFYGEPTETYEALAPGHTPMAFINPIWIDADGDGRWTAPGLARLPLAIRHPHRLPTALPE